MISDSIFCCICNSLVFEDFNGRQAARCQICGSIERHRGFALALLTLPLSTQLSLCVVRKKNGKPKYLQLLSKYVKMDFVSEDQLGQVDKTYDVVYHDHLLSAPFKRAEDYPQLLSKLAEILAPGGVQIFTVNKVALLGDLLKPPLRIVGGFTSGLTEGIGEGPEGGTLLAFDPEFRYSNGIADNCGLGRSCPVVPSGDVVFAQYKPPQLTED